MKILYTLFLIVCSVCSASEVHLICVATTNDPRAGTFLERDAVYLNSVVDQLVKDGDLVVKKKFFLGDDAIPFKILDYIKNELHCDSDDTILFYFFGHGYRLDSKDKMKNPWPNLLGADGKACDFERINALLKEKNPRLLLSFADCCNSYLPEHFFDWLWLPEEVRDFVNPELMKEKIQHLFIKNRGYVIATAAHPGQYGWIVPIFDESSDVYLEEDGNISVNNFNSLRSRTIFTTFFLETIKQHIASFDERVDWFSIMAETTRKCHDLKIVYNGQNFFQVPQYDMCLEK